LGKEEKGKQQKLGKKSLTSAMKGEGEERTIFSSSKRESRGPNSMGGERRGRSSLSPLKEREE